MKRRDQLVGNMTNRRAASIEKTSPNKIDADMEDRFSEKQQAMVTTNTVF
jgi:hypothetical protein